jgi:hypothetical protein
MKTIDRKYPDIWDKDGIAPFNSEYVGSQILSFSNDCPIKSIGFYSGNQKERNISLLEIDKIESSKISGNNIQISFKFCKKFNIKSQVFETEISKFSNKLLFNIKEEIVLQIIEKYRSTLNKVKDQTISFKEESIRYLSDYFYSPKYWKGFEKVSAALFSILGFQIDFRGHEYEGERFPDFFANTPLAFGHDRICIVVECKNQNNYFINTADERAMKEYIEDKKSIITQEGIRKEDVYFIFVVKSASTRSFPKLHEISKSTDKTNGAIISYKNLLYLTERRLKLGYMFYLEKFYNLFENREILPTKIDFLYKSE